MPTGFTGLYLPEVSHLDVQKWNQVIEEVYDRVLKDFLPGRGLGFDYDFQTWREAGGGFKPWNLDHLLYPREASGWHFGDMKGEEGGVFVLGPFATSKDGPKNVVIFCAFEFKHQVRQFFEALEKFVAKQVPWILDDLQPIGYQALWVA